MDSCGRNRAASQYQSFEDLGGGSDFAKDAALHTDHDQRSFVQVGFARMRGITHRETAIPEVDGGTQRRADAYLRMPYSAFS